MNYQLEINADDLRIMIDALDIDIEALMGMLGGEDHMEKSYAEYKLPKLCNLKAKLQILEEKIKSETDWLPF